LDIVGTGLQRSLQDIAITPYQDRLPWLGGDLQTLRNSFKRPPAPLVPDERMLAPIDVGAINLAVNRPPGPTDRALVLVHGLGGSEASIYMGDAARHFLARGFRVFRMNYRGVGPSAETSEPPYSAGLTSDLRAVLRRVRRAMPGAAIYIMGFSLGGQLSLRMMGEGDVPPDVKACVTVSAPLDLATSQRQLARRRNRLYSNYVVSNMQTDLRAVAHPKVSADPLRLRTIWDFDQQIIAPVFGFKGAADYYERVSCYPLLSRIDVPTLAIHAADDPWIPAEEYRTAAWPTDSPAGALITPGGGHVGFHAKNIGAPWHLHAAVEFFAKF